MTKKIIEPEIGTGLEDSEFRSYKYDIHEDKIYISIELWNAKICLFEFYDHILFLDRGAGDIMGLCMETSETDLFKEAIERMCGTPPPPDKYKLYQFLDVDDDPCLEIICTHFTCKLFQ